MVYADRVKETTTVTGTGAATLLGTTAGCRAISAAYGVGDRVPYCIESQTPGEWEVGSGTLTDSTHLARTTVLASSNGGSLVNFSAGTKNVFATAPAAELNKMATVDTISFATAVPLTAIGSRLMPLHSITGPTTFTVSGTPVAGAYVQMHLLANATDEPVLPGRKAGTSMDWTLTDNVLHVVWVWYDGYDVWHHIMSELDAVAEPVAATAVTLTGSTTGVVGTPVTYTVGTNGTRAAPVTVPVTPVTNVTFSPTSVTLPAGTGTLTFTATSSTTGAKTIAVTNDGGLTNPSSITLTVNAAATVPDAPTIGTATAGDGTVSVAFTAPASDGGSAITGYTATLYKVSDNTSAGSNTGASSPISVTATNGVAVYAKAKATNAVGTGAESAASNSVTPAAAVSYIRLSPIAAMTESGAGPYAYAGTGGTYGSAIGGVSSVGLQSGVDGSLAQTVGALTATGNEPMLGINPGTTVVAFGSLTYCFYAEGVVGNYAAFTGGSSKTVTNTVARANGDIMRLRRAGTTLYAEVARTATPTVFTEIANWTGVSTAAFKFQCTASGTSTIGTLTGVSLA